MEAGEGRCLIRTTHKEDAIAREMASGLVSALNVPVLVCCGIHIENITADEIVLQRKQAGQLK